MPCKLLAVVIEHIDMPQAAAIERDVAVLDKRVG